MGDVTIKVANGGAGNVNGPASSTANGIARFNGTSGKVLKSSLATIDDSGNIKTPGNITGAAPVSLTADRALTAADDGARFDNRGATGVVIATLPASAGLANGWAIDLLVKASQTLQLLAQGSDVIVHGGVATGAAGYAQSSFKGAFLRVRYTGDGEFFVTQEDGTWDFAP